MTLRFMRSLRSAKISLVLSFSLSCCSSSSWRVLGFEAYLNTGLVHLEQRFDLTAVFIFVSYFCTCSVIALGFSSSSSSAASPSGLSSSSSSLEKFCAAAAAFAVWLSSSWLLFSSSSLCYFSSISDEWSLGVWSLKGSSLSSPLVSSSSFASSTIICWATSPWSSSLAAVAVSSDSVWSFFFSFAST